MAAALSDSSSPPASKRPRVASDMEELLSVIRHWLAKVYNVQNSMLTTTFLESGGLSIQVKWWSTMQRLFVYNLTCGDGELSAFQWSDFTFICRRLLASGVVDSGSSAIADIHLVGFADVDALHRRHKIDDLNSQLRSLEDVPLEYLLSEALIKKYTARAEENAKKRNALLDEILQLQAAEPRDGLEATLTGLGWRVISHSEFSLGKPLQFAHL